MAEAKQHFFKTFFYFYFFIYFFYSPCITSARHLDDASFIIIKECFDNIFSLFFFVQGEDVKTTLVVENLAKDRLSSVGKTPETESQREGTERDGSGGGGGEGGAWGEIP